MFLVLIIDFILELDLQYLWTFYTIFAIQKEPIHRVHRKSVKPFRLDYLRLAYMHCTASHITRKISISFSTTFAAHFSDQFPAAIQSRH